MDAIGGVLAQCGHIPEPWVLFEGLDITKSFFEGTKAALYCRTRQYSSVSEAL